MRYFELIDDLGQDYYRADGHELVDRWHADDGVWCFTLLNLSDLLEIGASEYTISFHEVTEDDVR